MVTDVCRLDKNFIFSLSKLSLKVLIVQTSAVFVSVPCNPDVMELFVERAQAPSQRTIMLLRSEQNIPLMFCLLLGCSRNC